CHVRSSPKTYTLSLHAALPICWCAENGLRVPADLAIIGFDDIEFAEYAAVPLSTVRYAVESVTSMAVERLMQLILAGDQLPAPRVTRIDPELVIRESSGG